jgi:hypothetical protein
MGGAETFQAVAAHFFGMVVPEYKKQGPVQVGNDKIQLVHRKIPRAQNHTHIRKTFLY